MLHISQLNKLPKEFYNRDVNTVAKELLGKIFCKTEKGKLMAGRIVEVEAYAGAIDKSAHSYRGKTDRNKVMFGDPGHLYVYFIYGVHYCANVVTGDSGVGDAVLLRGIEPLTGLEEMIHNRAIGTGKKNSRLNLTNGPGKICKSFGIDKLHNGKDLLGEEVFICEGEKLVPYSIVETTRIGISKSKELKWRYYLKNNSYVSKL